MAKPVAKPDSNLDMSRLYSEPSDPLRIPFELDRHRIINCTAFRRLQNKTQVFAPQLHDHFRNRLTHSLEVAQIARCLARNGGGNLDLSEAIGLAHDLGHPPFSHAGEKALNELMTGRGGFNHNAHSLRVVEYLEHPYPAFRGLNLTRATLEGLRVHATQFDKAEFEVGSTPSLEARIASLADRIAYDLHDLEDAIGAEIITENHLKKMSLWDDVYVQVADGAESKPIHSVRRPVLDAILNTMLTDAVRDKIHVQLSPQFETRLRQLEELLLKQVYQHPDVARADAEGQRKIHELFSAYMRNPDLLPDRFVERIADHGPHRVMCDYIAGMTDSYCAAQHGKHCPRSC